MWLRGNVGTMIISWFLFAISSSITTPYMSKYLKLLGATDEEVGLVRSLGSLAVMATILPGGVLTDLIGRRRSIVVGTWAIAAAQFLYVFVGDWRQFAAVYVLDWALHFYQPALTAILLDSLPPERRGGGMMLTAVLPQVPWLFLPPVGGYLLDQYGLWGMRLSYIMSGIISTVVAALRMRALEETIPPPADRGDPLLREVARAYLIWRSFPQMHSFVLYATVLGFLINLAQVAMATFGVLYATEVLGLDNASWGVIQSAGMAVAIVFGLVLMPAVDRAPRAVALLSGLLLVAVGYFMAAAWRNVVALVAAAILIGIGGEVATSIRRAVVGDLISPENRGRIMGTTLALEYMGVMVGGVAFGYIYQRSHDAAFLISGGIAAISALPALNRVLRSGL